MIEPKEQIGTALIMPRAGRNEVCGKASVQRAWQGVNGLETGLEHVEPKCSGISIIPFKEEEE